MRDCSPATSSAGIKDFFAHLVSPALDFLLLNCYEAVLDEDALCYQLNSQCTQEVMSMDDPIF